MATNYTVIGPIGGIYHVGFYTDSGRFLSAHEFESKDLADVTVWRLNQQLRIGEDHGR